MSGSRQRKYLYLHSQHPGYDLSMEVLISLPPEPSFAVGRELVDDLRLGTQGHLMDLVSRLRTEGYLIESRWGSPSEGLRGRILSIKRESWPLALSKGREYYQQVYG